MTIKTHSGFSAPKNSVIVVRRGPDHLGFGEVFECIDSLVNKGHAVEVFLQGPGVTPASSDVWASRNWPSAAVSVTLCQSAWQRLNAAHAQPRYPLTSLIQVWAHMLEATEVHCFGTGHWPADWPSSAYHGANQGFGCLITGQPSASDQQSMIECVLAGVSLEVDLVVACPDWDGQRSPMDWVSGWDQLIEHGLASVITKHTQDAKFSERCWLVL